VSADERTPAATLSTTYLSPLMSPSAVVQRHCRDNRTTTQMYTCTDVRTRVATSALPLETQVTSGVRVGRSSCRLRNPLNRPGTMWMKQDGNGATSPRRSPAGDMSTTIRAPLVAADCGQRWSAGRGLCVRTTARRAPAPYVGEASHPSTTEATRARRNRPSVQPSIPIPVLVPSPCTQRRKTNARRKKEMILSCEAGWLDRYGHNQPGRHRR
jgi:hypothetical protein